MPWTETWRLAYSLRAGKSRGYCTNTCRRWSTRKRCLPSELARKCARASGSSSDALTVKNHAYDGLSRLAGGFPVLGNSTTNTQRSTVRCWPFFLRAPACSRGLLRISADFLPPVVSPISAPFRSLLAILLSSLARQLRAEVRRGRNVDLYRSMGYVLTNQTVGLRHRQAKETMAVVFCR